MSNSRVWEEVNSKYAKKPDEVDAIDGLLVADSIVRKLDEEMPSDWTIYMRVYGAPLTAKTDLMMFLRENGIGGIGAEKTNGVETDKIAKERYWRVGSWNTERISREMPDIIVEVSSNYRLVIFEGVYSTLFHPSCKLWLSREEGMISQYAMDIEVECVASWEVREKRALRRDGTLHKLRSFGNVAQDWMTLFDGRDLVINTNLAEDIPALDRRISLMGGSIGKDQLEYFRRYREHCLSMKQRYESQR